MPKNSTGSVMNSLRVDKLAVKQFKLKIIWKSINGNSNGSLQLALSYTNIVDPLKAKLFFYFFY